MFLGYAKIVAVKLSNEVKLRVAWWLSWNTRRHGVRDRSSGGGTHASDIGIWDQVLLEARGRRE
jgi:hypothetical protein